MLGMHSEAGNYREVNQDFMGYKFWQNGGIFIVADGMGGYKGGEVASRLAVETFLNEMEKINYDEIDISILDRMVNKSNQYIFEESNENESLKGMGTTLTFLVINSLKCIVGNIGDSCCFLYREGKLSKITRDHSLVQAFVDSGSITEEEAKNHPNKNIITRSLGTSKTVMCDFFELKIDKNDKFLLCTDGLSNHLKMDYIESILGEFDEVDSVRILSEKSKENGSRDNISVMVVKGECRDDR